MFTFGRWVGSADAVAVANSGRTAARASADGFMMVEPSARRMPAATPWDPASTPTASRRSASPSEPDVAGLARWLRLSLVRQRAQTTHDGTPRRARPDDLVDVAERRRLVRVGEALRVLLREARA